MQGDGLAEVESAQLTSHIFSQSFSWSPLARLYLQCSASLVLEQTDTPVDEALGANQAVLDSEQNYWNGTFSVGYAFTENTDVQGQYFYYRADNYVNNAAFSQPYGVGAEEHGVSVTLQHRFNPRLTGRLRYGFYRSQNETEGGRNDYDAHMIYSSVTYLF
jgi:hypothetical protein